MATFPTVAHYWRDFSDVPESALRRDTVEAGPPKQRRVKSRVMRTVRMKLAFFSKAEFDSFMTFFTVTVKNGQDWFDFTHPRTGQVVQARFVAGQELAPTEHLRATLDLIDLPIVLEYWSG